MVYPYILELRTERRMWAVTWVGLAMWACISPVIHTPAQGYIRSETSAGHDNSEIVSALNNIVQALDSHERHNALYERVSKLEESLHKKTQNEVQLESEVSELRAKIPLLEAEIQTIPEMRKDLAEFEAKIEKLVHDYEAKLSTLASEVIRLKKNGARRKDLQTLSDGSDVLLRADVPPCPEVGLGMTAERVGEQCLYFSWGSALNWTDAHRHCQSLGGDLSAPEDLLPLKTFLHRAFARGPSIWLGASYNIEDTANITHSNITGGRGIPPSDPLGDQSSVNPTEDHGNGSFSFSLNISGSPEMTSNTIEESDDGEDSQDDEPSRLVISNGITLRDEAMSPEDGDVQSDFTSLSRRFIELETLFGPPAKRNLNSVLRDSSPTPVVDFILLKDASRSADVMDDASSTSDIRTPERRPSGDPAPGSSPLPTASSPVDSSVVGVSSAISRDVREVVEGSLGKQESGDSEHSGKAKMNCILLQQKESLEYELVGQPCNEQHRFVCEIFTSKSSDLKFTPDNLLHE